MTRMLSELLGAREPDFRLGLQRLEQASGEPNADIRLSSEILQRTQAKIRELGLDPHDTTGEELYSSLLERLKHDEVKVRQALRLDKNADGVAVMSAVERTLRTLEVPKSCFALKHSVAKRLLQKRPPKKAMAALGYRSLESFLKHEPVSLIYAAAWATEAEAWRRDFIAQYAALSPSDFEPRAVEIVLPQVGRWTKLANQLTTVSRHNSLYFPELGAIILLPLSETKPGLALVSLLFALLELNDIRSASALLKLQQVKPNFGGLVAQVASGAPLLGTNLAGQPLSWQVVRHYYGNFPENYRADIFEPHVQADDLAWQQAEAVLAKAIPALEFWSDSATLALLDRTQPVSLNLFDVALSYCNQLPFAERIVQFLQQNLWHELLLRYLHQDALEQSLLGQLQTELVGEPAMGLD
jgi:hypothetical protein